MAEIAGWQIAAIYVVLGLMVLFTKVLFWGRSEDEELPDFLLFVLWPYLIPVVAFLAAIYSVGGFVAFVQKLHVATNSEEPPE